MGLTVHVFKHPLGDCTNGGISGKATKLCVVNIEGPFEPSWDVPAVILNAGPMGNPVFHPARKDFGENWKPETGWFMMGGNYAATSDSRFGEALRAMGCNFYGAIPIHDRQE